MTLVVIFFVVARLEAKLGKGVSKERGKKEGSKVVGGKKEKKMEKKIGQVKGGRLLMK